jgi:hypothetical protein
MRTDGLLASITKLAASLGGVTGHFGVSVVTKRTLVRRGLQTERVNQKEANRTGGGCKRQTVVGQLA